MSCVGSLKPDTHIISFQFKVTSFRKQAFVGSVTIFILSNIQAGMTSVPARNYIKFLEEACLGMDGWEKLPNRANKLQITVFTFKRHYN